VGEEENTVNVITGGLEVKDQKQRVRRRAPGTFPIPDLLT
jgi:hypothetical protein